MKRTPFKPKLKTEPEIQLRKAYKLGKKISFGERGRRNKYGAIKTWVDGIKWPSQLQAGHYIELKALQAAKIISDLEWEVDFPIKIAGILICNYRADFVFTHKGRNKKVIFESKGKRTDVFNIKWKLMKACYPEYDFELVTDKSLCNFINGET